METIRRHGKAALLFVVMQIFIITATLFASIYFVRASNPPEDVVRSHFGLSPWVWGNNRAIELGARWVGPRPGPFIWGRIEREKGKYNWDESDSYVRTVQRDYLGILATIWPFAEWDQEEKEGSERRIFEHELGYGRSKPRDMEAYSRLVEALVERYDGDHNNDMPGLRYPIKHWEVINEPSLQGPVQVFFKGTPEDYFDILSTTHRAIRRADPEAKVLHGGIGCMSCHTKDFWEKVFNLGADKYFDIANIHSNGSDDGFNVPEFKELLQEYSINKPIWITEVSLSMGGGYGEATLKEMAVRVVKSCTIAFSAGAERIFWRGLNGLVRENDGRFTEERLTPFYALRTMMQKVGLFESIEKISAGQYRFTIGEKSVYILWGPERIPADLTGKVVVTDIMGKEQEKETSELTLSDMPVFIEEV